MYQQSFTLNAILFKNWGRPFNFISLKIFSPVKSNSSFPKNYNHHIEAETVMTQVCHRRVRLE